MKMLINESWVSDLQLQDIAVSTLCMTNYREK